MSVQGRKKSGKSSQRQVGRYSSSSTEVITNFTCHLEETLLLKGLDTAHMVNGDIHDSCMTGTREQILEEARVWRANEDPETPQIFWLADVAGSGKSTV
jgi:hypothetical protein